MKALLLSELEALLFAAEAPLSRAELHRCLETHQGQDLAWEELDQALLSLHQRYASNDFAFELRQIAQGYQLLTKAQHHDLIGLLLKQKSQKKLSRAALETLAVVAYQQPVTKADIEAIRGVNCDYALQKLLEKELIEIKGRAQLVGRPLLYATSHKFMQHFGLASLKELPKLREWQNNDSPLGPELEA